MLGILLTIMTLKIYFSDTLLLYTICHINNEICYLFVKRTVNPSIFGLLELIDSRGRKVWKTKTWLIKKHKRFICHKGQRRNNKGHIRQVGERNQLAEKGRPARDYRSDKMVQPFKTKVK